MRVARRASTMPRRSVTTALRACSSEGRTASTHGVTSRASGVDRITTACQAVDGSIFSSTIGWTTTSATDNADEIVADVLELGDLGDLHLPPPLPTPHTATTC